MKEIEQLSDCQHVVLLYANNKKVKLCAYKQKAQFAHCLGSTYCGFC